jgi:ectoine hydroxylase-related dioxygenase (phytanoyl-CoA dioxygenase family)
MLRSSFVLVLCSSVVTAFAPLGVASRVDNKNQGLNYGLYDVQEEMLVNRGILEESLMSGKGEALEAHKPKGVGSSGGFGDSKGASSGSNAEGKAHAKVLSDEGVVRIDNVLPGKMADKLRDFVFDLREQATSDVKAGRAKQLDRFADVLLKSNRCDLTMPLGPDIVTKSLQQLLCKSSVRDTMEELISPEAILYELSCLISDPGSQRQNVHPDNPVIEQSNLSVNEPTLLTCFVALQDIDMSMGPTVWIPNTHTREVHEKFQNEQPGYDGEDSPKDGILRNSPHKLGLLKKGSCAIFDSRLLHCGSANRSEGTSRALFYFSFKNPKVGYPGNPASIRKEIGDANLGLQQLSLELEQCKGKKNSAALAALAATLK